MGSVSKLGLVSILSIVLLFYSPVSYAGNMGWVYEYNELRASYAGNTWWLVGDEVTLSINIANMDERRNMNDAYTDIILVSPSSERINVTRVRLGGVYPLKPGEMRGFTVNWDSTGREPGYYRLELQGAADFEYGEDKELSNFMDDAVKLFAWDHPVFRPRIFEVELPKTDFVPGEPFTCDVTVDNQGNVPVFAMTYMTLRSPNENDTILRPQMMDEPGVIYKEGETYTSHFKTWLPSELPLGTYTCEVNVVCFAAWPSTDGSGWIPWPSGEGAYTYPWPEYSGEYYYPYPMEDPSLGYPVVLSNATWLYMPWPTGGYEGAWSLPEGTAYSPPGGGLPCGTSECGEGIYGWSDFLCEYSYGPSTCQSYSCGEINVESPVYDIEILDYAFTEIPIPIGEKTVVVAEVANEGNTPVETDWYVFSLDTETVVSIETLPTYLEPDCDTVVQLYMEFEDMAPGDYELQLNVEGYSPWPSDVEAWMQSEFLSATAGFLFDGDGLVDPEVWLHYTGITPGSDPWPTYNNPSISDAGPPGLPAEFGCTDSFFEVFYEIDFSGEAPLCTYTPPPVSVGLAEPPSTPEPDTPPYSEPRFSDWLIGDDVIVTATIFNTGDLPITMEIATIFGVYPDDVSFIIGQIDDTVQIESGESHDWPFVWSSKGASAGLYGMSLGGAVAFSDGSGQMLYNLEDNAWFLVDPDAPTIETEIVELSLTSVDPIQVGGPFSVNVKIQNSGNTPIFPLFQLFLVNGDVSIPLPNFDIPGTLYMPGETWSHDCPSWIPSDTPPGTYDCVLYSQYWCGWPSDDTGFIPSSHVDSNYTYYTGTYYYPYPTAYGADSTTGYSMELPDGTYVYYPWTARDLTSYSWSGDDSYSCSACSEELSGLYNWDDFLYGCPDAGPSTAEQNIVSQGLVVAPLPETCTEVDDVIPPCSQFDLDDPGECTEWTISLDNKYNVPVVSDIDVFLDSELHGQHLLDDEDPLGYRFVLPGENDIPLELTIPDSLPPGEYRIEVEVRSLPLWPHDLDSLLGDLPDGTIPLPLDIDLPSGLLDQPGGYDVINPGEVPEDWDTRFLLGGEILARARDPRLGGEGSNDLLLGRGDDSLSGEGGDDLLPTGDGYDTFQGFDLLDMPSVSELLERNDHFTAWHGTTLFEVLGGSAQDDGGGDTPSKPGGIPGFPLESILTGLVIIFIIQNLSRRTRT